MAEWPMAVVFDANVIRGLEKRIGRLAEFANSLVKSARDTR
jgi:hypothetical protein